jgi:hypothetical protein
VGFVVDKVALGQVFSEYFGFHCQFSFHRLLTLTIVYYLELVQLAKQWPTYHVDSVSPHPKKLKKKLCYVGVEKISGYCEHDW